MKCSASPTICTAAEATPPAELARDVVAAVLFREVLTPIAASMGALGDVVLGPVVDELFVRRAR